MLPALSVPGSRLVLLEDGSSQRGEPAQPAVKAPALVLLGLPPLPGPQAPAAGAAPSPAAVEAPDSPSRPASGSRAPAAEDRLDTSPVWRIVIPVLDLDARVVGVPLADGTWDVSGIGEQIAWLGGTSTPGLAGNTALAGHVTLRKGGNGPFYFLHRLAPGDRVYVYTERGEYVYRVREQAVVKQDDVAVVGPTINAQLTLLTCANWNEKDRTYIQRRAVFADLVQIRPLEADEE